MTPSSWKNGSCSCAPSVLPLGIPIKTAPPLREGTSFPMARRVLPSIKTRPSQVAMRADRRTRPGARVISTQASDGEVPPAQ
jgi:hypothetical protein